MRSIWLIFGALLLALVGLGYWLRQPTPQVVRQPAAAPIVLVSQHGASRAPAPAGGPARDSIVRLALRQLGTPYVWAGTSPRTGFDCSGFITYVFSRFGVATPHATALLIDAGRPVPRAQAQPGDIVVFTGTTEGSTTPGHAGIVISALGETPLRFVHASSARRESGVKVSQVENSGYERRFMQVRRVLDGAALASPALAATSQPTATRPLARPAGAVTPLAPATPAVTADLAAAPPVRVAPLPVRLRPHTKPSAKLLKPSSKSTAANKSRSLAKPTASASKSLLKKTATKKVTPKKPILTRKKTTRPAASPKPAPHRVTSKSR
jgi:hypothetical protein